MTKRISVWTMLTAAAVSGLTSLLPLPAYARHHHRHHHAQSEPTQPAQPPMDLSPVVVTPYVLPDATDPHKANVLRDKFHLENGVDVKATRYITNSDVTSRDLFILQITQSLEGGFDSVNMYDRGVLSWGIMQWTAHAGSLQRCLVSVKRQLRDERQTALWDKLFTRNGVTVDADHVLIYGHPITDPTSARLLLRGTIKPGHSDPKMLAHWASVFARAGRQPQVQQAEVEYAGKVVDGVLGQNLTGLPYHLPGRTGLTVDDLAGNDPYAEALIFALWTNNPAHAAQYVAAAARAARGVSQSDDPSLWVPGAFSDALMRECRQSRFGNWAQRAALIAAREQSVHTDAPGLLTPFERQYQVQIAARKVQRHQEMAERQAQTLRVIATRRRPAGESLGDSDVRSH